MIKFMLILQICHASIGACLPPIQDNLLYNSYKECAMNGYLKGYEFMEKQNIEQINETRTVVRFWCQESDNA